MTDYAEITLMPHGRRIRVRPGKNLMETLMEQGIFLRSDCGGRGTCKKCRVDNVLPGGEIQEIRACSFSVGREDIRIEIPASSLMSSHVLNKAPASLPASFTDRFKDIETGPCFGAAIDLGTTTIAVYLCDIVRGSVISTVALKNPQSLYGDDVMSRIGAIGESNANLRRLQRLVVSAIEWGLNRLLKTNCLDTSQISGMVAVGNPTMIHILAGIDPGPIGLAPYQPVFHEAKTFQAADLGFGLGDVPIQTLPQVSGFIGGDILAAALAVDLENQPDGTLLVDLGTNGELMLKQGNRLFAASCATGPAFEGAAMDFGMQAIPGAVRRVHIDPETGLARCSVIQPASGGLVRPAGLCGTGMVSAVAELLKRGIVEPTGAFATRHPSPALSRDGAGRACFVLVPGGESADGTDILVSQKDIRSIQLGKGALITGIEFLLKAADLERPARLVIAGAFGTYLDKADMMALGMIPVMEPGDIDVPGNSAGAGAVMVLSVRDYLEAAVRMAEKTTTVELAMNPEFQRVFVDNLRFP